MDKEKIREPRDFAKEIEFYLEEFEEDKGSAAIISLVVIVAWVAIIAVAVYFVV